MYYIMYYNHYVLDTFGYHSTSAGLYYVLDAIQHPLVYYRHNVYHNVGLTHPKHLW